MGTLHLLLDASYCLHLIATRPASLAAALAAYAPGAIGVSAVTVAALRARARASRDPARNLAALEKFLLPLTIVSFDAATATAATATAATATAAAPLNGEAALVAAQALQHNATLVTRQPAHYTGVAGLRVQHELDGMALSVTQPRAPARPAAAPANRRQTIVVSGSHDLSLELLADWLHSEHPALALATAHVGSIDGLLALQRGEAHLAGAHLLDADTGEFNVGHVRRLLTPQGVHVVLLGFVRRIQGLIVARGNPKQIHTLQDLVRDDVAFINRQAGSGTSLLLDYHLRRERMAAGQIRGYDHRVATHMAVASAVAQGRADCGLGIQAAATAVGLDFAPLFDERYDLVIPVEHFHSPLLEPLVAALRRPDHAFAQRVAALGGYDTAAMGRVLAEM
jgi:molybdate-binding protein/predicted nucleic acid-binding protein